MRGRMNRWDYYSIASAPHNILALIRIPEFWEINLDVTSNLFSDEISNAQESGIFQV